jgi:hypothetical protein
MITDPVHKAAAQRTMGPLIESIIAHGDTHALDISDFLLDEDACASLFAWWLGTPGATGLRCILCKDKTKLSPISRDGLITTNPYLERLGKAFSNPMSPPLTFRLSEISHLKLSHLHEMSPGEEEPARERLRQPLLEWDAPGLDASELLALVAEIDWESASRLTGLVLDGNKFCCAPMQAKSRAKKGSKHDENTSEEWQHVVALGKALSVSQVQTLGLRLTGLTSKGLLALTRSIRWETTKLTKIDVRDNGYDLHWDAVDKVMETVPPGCEIVHDKPLTDEARAQAKDQHKRSAKDKNELARTANGEYGSAFLSAEVRDFQKVDWERFEKKPEADAAVPEEKQDKRRKEGKHTKKKKKKGGNR